MDPFLKLQRSRYSITEGSIGPEHIDFIHAFCSRPNVRRVLEIGFNGGISSAAFLSARPDIEVVSFDLGAWPYVADAKRLVDELFPGRHTLILGDSTVTVPEYNTDNAEPFDLAFVDGGHTTPVPDLDIANCLPLLRAHDGFVIVDDYCEAYGSEGVIRAYDAAVERGDLRTVAGPYSASGGRGWIVAKKTY